MELTDAQKQAVTRWVGEGCTLAEIQRRLNDEFKLAMTYMDVRFLLLDLGLQLKEPKPAKPAGPTLEAARGGGPKAPKEAGRGGLLDRLGRAVPAGGGGVSVELDRISRPGAIVSGSVTFSDGVTAQWVLDQMGRLGLEAKDRSYRPSEDDLQTFQEAVSRKLQEHGY
jgi:hypothetical protein